MGDDEYKAELETCIKRILTSTSPKKLIVAGPGTGKTTFFKTLINAFGGQKNQYLVLTFINELVKELKNYLGEIAHVSSFHGYCHLLLRDYGDMRYGLKSGFEYYPPLIELIKSDWEIMNNNEAPSFFDVMRNTIHDEKTGFFIQQANYYNAVGFDDSVFRVLLSFRDKKILLKQYEQIIVDEFQDFNKLEVAVLTEFVVNNPILIVGDDDQALYCTLRGSDPAFIRELYGGSEFETFSLPFCHRCPEAVITVFKSLLEKAKTRGHLNARIDKQFDFYPLSKRRDSERYPYVKLVRTTIQRRDFSGNYFGRYILQEIQKIPAEEIKESQDKGFPTVLIIGPKHFLESITPVFDEKGYQYEIRGKHSELKIDLLDAIKILKKDQESILGWRIILEIYKGRVPKGILLKIVKNREKIRDYLPTEIQNEVSQRIESFAEEMKVEEEIKIPELNEPRIKLTTFEGAKGLSAQHVFIVGFQNGILPHNSQSIKDMEICKLLVALTRTRKQCHLMTTIYFGGTRVESSEFINWLGKTSIQQININKDSWNK